MTNKYSFDIDIKRPIPKHFTVCNGDEGVEFEAHLLDGGDPITLSLTTNMVYAVFVRSDGHVEVVTPSSSLDWTTGGIVTMRVPPECFRTGTNSVVFQIYEQPTGSELFILMATTCERRFYARPAAPQPTNN